MKLSLITPTHNPKYLKDLYASIKDQKFDEWVVVIQGNHDLTELGFLDTDKRISCEVVPHLGETYVGAIKNYAFHKAEGDILVEVDHDDILTNNAIARIRQAFEDHPDVGFVFSNFAEFEKDLKPRSPYPSSLGWKSRAFPYGGETLAEMVAFEATPASLSRIWYAPNHVRAWRADIYRSIGGHNVDMKILDDQDLICRTYLVTKFQHIDECLYLYRVDGNNTYLKYNDEIQQQTWTLYHKYIHQLADRWADLNKYRKLDMGGRFNGRSGYESVDLRDADVIMDAREEWPIADGSVGVILANDFMEHIPDKLHLIKEIYRVLAPGGYFFSMTPSTDGLGAFQDPTHVAFYNENSFLYYTDQALARFIDTPVRFQQLYLNTGYEGEWQRSHGIKHIYSHLLALKEDVRPPGEIKI